MKQDFVGKSVLITGATSGIGLATAEEFAARGASLLVTGRNERAGAALADRLGSGTGRVVFLAADMTGAGTAERLVDVSLAHFGKLDVLVNNAGILFRGDATRCTDEEWDLTIQTNVTSVFRMSRAALRRMIPAGGGVIVNIASDWGLVGARDALAYGVSKGAIVQLTRSMAIDHARQGIRVNAVCPGDTDTRMLDVGASGMNRRADRAELGGAIPMGRVGTATEVARVVCFAASDEASFVTGAMLPVDGGNSAA